MSEAITEKMISEYNVYIVNIKVNLLKFFTIYLII